MTDYEKTLDSFCEWDQVASANLGDAARWSRDEIARLRAERAELVAVLEAIVSSNSYWWQEVGEDVANNAAALLARIKKGSGK